MLRPPAPARARPCLRLSSLLQRLVVGRSLARLLVLHSGGDGGGGGGKTALVRDESVLPLLNRGAIGILIFSTTPSPATGGGVGAAQGVVPAYAFKCENVFKPLCIVGKTAKIIQS